MKYFLFIFILSSSIYAQPCNVTDVLKNIEQLSSQGIFDKALDQTKQLLKCDSLSLEDQIDLYIWKYQLYRNLSKKKSANRAMQKADKLIKKLNFSNVTYTMLLAESQAFIRDDKNYHNTISKINVTQLDSLNQTRYFFSQFLVTDKVGKTHTAIDYLQKGLAIVGNISPYYKAEILEGLGNMNSILGDYDKSLSYYKSELNILNSVYAKDQIDVTKCHYHIGNMYYGKLEYQKALDHYLIAHKVWTKVFEPNYRYMRYINEAIGDMYWELDDKKNALKYFNLATAGEKNKDNDISKTYLKQADSLLEKGSYGEAINYYNEAYEWRKNTFGENHVVTGACQNFVARAIASKGNIEDALDNYQKAIDIFVTEMDATSWHENPTLEMTIQSHHYLLESLIAKSNLLKRIYIKYNHISDLEIAFNTQETAIKILDAMKSRQTSKVSRLFWTNQVTVLIEESIETAMQLYRHSNDKLYLEKAFQFSEKNKALQLLSVIQNQNIEAFSNISVDLINEEKELKKAVSLLTGKIANEENRCSYRREKMIELWTNELETKRNQYDLLLNSIKTTNPDYYKLKHSLKITTLNEVQNKILDDKTALVSFFIGTNNSYSFFITKNDISIREISSTSQLTEQSRKYYKLISSKEEFIKNPSIAYKKYTQTSYKLYRILLEPELKKFELLENLIIIPDGILTYVPFESLLTQESDFSSRNYKNLSYLLKTKTVSYSPSATIKVNAQMKTITNSDYVGFAPDYENQAYSDSRKKLSKLKHNTTEVEYGSKLFNGKKFTGNAVTETLLKEQSKLAGILHLALHGDIEDTEPLLSKLYFNSSDTEDGLLHTYEIYNLNIPSQLIILSACNTASGKLLKGEGVLSLERAFQYSGSHSLVSTLWSVDDNASSQLTQLFLKQLKNGKAKDKALQNAKLSYLNSVQPELLPPYYWSSFKLTGNTKALAKSSKLIPVLIGFIIFLLVVISIRKLKRNKKLAA